MKLSIANIATLLVMKKRLFIVSNRLPLIVDEEKGILPASGGLITAISSYLEKFKGSGQDTEVYWVGVPGCSQEVWQTASASLDQSSYNYLPVFVPDADYENYYNGHSNSVIWPLFHYFPSYAEYNQEFYESYLRVNDLFSEVLAQELTADDTVWIHDYHLMPLPQLLRTQIPTITIGFFLHIPFPSFELIRLLPKKWQENILAGLLGADLIGFHTMDYASHFLQSILMVLGLDNDRHIVHYNNRLIKIDVFPISIDFKKFNNAFDNEAVLAQKVELLREMNHRKVIFSVDRLDYSKGVQNRLKAYECFLQQYPEYHNNVVFIIVIVPSRDTIAKYVERKRMIDELISNINSKIGNIHWVPVIYQYNSLNFEEMVALYNTCDLAMITPLRDGMNLVAKEFVASRKDKKGVLILSEMAGAARELTDALIINPNDITEIAQKIKEGLEMSPEEQSSRMEKMQTRISNYDVRAWADDYMRELHTIVERQQSFEIKLFDDHTRRTLIRSYSNAGTRLLLLDYDGTLVPFSPNPEMAVPGPHVMRLLKELSENELNDVYLISGRNASFLDKHFGALPVHLVAEHGARFRAKNSEWNTEIQLHDEWKSPIHNIMEMYVRRCANSFIEEKEFSMVWHYRNANLEQGKLRALELSGELNEYIQNKHLQVLMGNKIVEVRQSGINKGNFVKRVLDKKSFDFVLAVGDDKTDEDMFRTLLEYDHAFTIKVGTDASYAKFNVTASPMVIGLLEGLNRVDSEVPLKT